VNLAEAGYDVYVDADTTHQLPKQSENLLPLSMAYPVEPSVFSKRGSGDSTIDVISPGKVKVVTTVGNNGGAGWEMGQSGGNNIPVLPNTAYTVSLDVFEVTGASHLLTCYGLGGTFPSPTFGIPVGFTGKASLNIVTGAATTSLLIQPMNNSGQLGSITFGNLSVRLDGSSDFKPGRNKKKTLNFLGKVTGSADSVPHNGYTVLGTLATTPTGTVNKYDWLGAQYKYDQIGKQDGTSTTNSHPTAGGYAQHLLEFDLSHLGLSLADLKSALRRLVVTWVGWGRGDNAGVWTNGATMHLWDVTKASGAGGWSISGDSAYITNTAGTPTSTVWNTTTWQNNMVTSDQKVYVLVHSTYPASATNASEVYTDYIKLDIELADWVDYVKTNGVKLKTNDPTKVKLAFPNTRDVIDIDYVKNDPRVKPKKNLVPTQTDMWESGSGGGQTATPDITRIRTKPAALAKPNTTYSIKVASGFEVYVFESIPNSLGTVGANGWANSLTFTSNVLTSELRVIIRKVDLSAITPADVQGAQPMLVEGSTAQAFEPYQLIGGFRNAIASRKVPKKNLFDGTYEVGSIDTTTGGDLVNSLRRRSFYIPVKPNTTYTLSNDGTFDLYTTFYTGAKVGGAYLNNNAINAGINKTTFTTGSNTAFIRFRNNDNQAFSSIQLEEGSSATPYEDYKLLDAKPSKPGLVMNGINDCLQLPSMTMDAIEIDCMVDLNQPVSGFHNIVDARTGLANGYVSFLNTGAISGGPDWNSVTGSDKGVRTKIMATAKQVFTDNVTIFGFWDGSKEFTKGVVYGVKCYLNGQVIKSYDATDLALLSGGKFLPKYNDLVPDFYSSAWNLHANALVYGKEWLKLNGTAAWQMSYVDIQAEGNKLYALNYACQQYNNTTLRADFLDVNKTTLTYLSNNKQTSANSTVTGTSPANCVYIRVYLQNDVIGTFEFKKPQLYRLDGTEAQVFGSPLPKVKTPRRVLDRIR
jgi:hypothetical protein